MIDIAMVTFSSVVDIGITLPLDERQHDSRSEIAPLEFSRLHVVISYAYETTLISGRRSTVLGPALRGCSRGSWVQPCYLPVIDAHINPQWCIHTIGISEVLTMGWCFQFTY